MSRHLGATAGRLAVGLAVVWAGYALMAFVVGTGDEQPDSASTALTGGLALHEPASTARTAARAEVAGVATPGPGQTKAEAPGASGPLTIVIPGITARVERIEPGPPEAFVQFASELQAAIDSYSVSGEYAIAVTDLQTGHTVGAYSDRSQLSGCVMNFFVILQAVLDVQEGRYPLDTVDSLIRATIWGSNATTARELYRIVGDGEAVAGVARVAALLQRLELAEVRIDHPPAYIGDSLGVDENNWLTAAAVNRALAMVWNGEVLDAAHRAYLLEAMTGVKAGLNYLVAYVPGPATVSHKNGFFPSSIGYIDNDAGIVHVQRDGMDYAYAVTFLSQGVPYKYGDIPLGQKLMRMAWDYFAETYGPPV